MAGLIHGRQADGGSVMFQLTALLDEPISVRLKLPDEPTAIRPLASDSSRLPEQRVSEGEATACLRSPASAVKVTRNYVNVMCSHEGPDLRIMLRTWASSFVGGAF